MGANWITDPMDDNGGVHTNNAVQNHMFYLLVEGSNGLPKNGVIVDGIGDYENMGDAEELAFYVMRHMITNSTQYPDAREAWVSAAEMLFGKCSDEHVQTMAAWAAVGIGAVECSDFDFLGPKKVCFNLPPVTYHVLGLPTASYSWVFPSQWTVNISGTGNSVADVISFGPTPPSFPHTETITVTSSTGISKSRDITLVTDPDECDEPAVPPCDPDSPQGVGIAPGLEDNSAIVKNNLATTEPELFPNPAKNYIIVRTPLFSDEMKTFFIYDSRGSQTASYNSTNIEVRIETGAYKPGLYYIRVISENYSHTMPFVISN